MKLKPVKTDHKPWHTDEYLAYLASEEWATTRAAALERAGHRCETVWVWQRVVREEGDVVWTEDCSERCPETRGLEVHHRHYRTLGGEAPGDLTVLCHDCHRDADRRRQYAKRTATLQRRYGDWRP